MADEEKQVPENDDWLNDFDESTDDIESADGGQADFDELFESFESGEHDDESDSPVNEESSSELGGAVVEEEEELDQASIDALLGDTGGAEAAPDSEASEESEPDASLEQSSIDELLGDTEGAEAAPEAEASLEGEEDSLDQSSIDELLGDSSGGEQAQEAPEGSTDDYITEAADESTDDMLEAEAVDFEEVLGTDEVEEEFSGDELDDEFDFGDELDALESDDEIMQAVDDTPLDDLFGEEEVSSTKKDISEEKTVSTSPDVPDAPAEVKSKRAMPGFIMAKLANVDGKKAAIGAVCLLILVGGLGLLMNSIGGNNNEPAIALPDQQEIMAGQQAMGNHPPEAKSGKFSMTADAAQVEIKLEAYDPEGAKVSYEISKHPEYGKLSGEPPLLTYQPGNDFAGEDNFEFRATDGTQAGQPGVVSIIGPDIAARLAGPVVIEPKRPVVKAKNQEVAALSTEPFIIDWREIWNRDNEGSMKNVSVEVSAKGLNGKLVRLDKYRHKYTPDPFSEGIEEFKFRFKKRGVTSKLRKMEMKVASGNPEPDLILVALDKESYSIGEMVVIDASKTRDDKRETLIFDCQQVSGVPVYFNHLNDEGSKVSFIMPSSFYTTDYPEPVIKMTAVDETGKTTSKDITVKLQRESFRQASLWSGLQRGKVPDPECPSGNCPGSRLP